MNIKLRQTKVSDSKFIYEICQNKDFQKYYLPQLIYKSAEDAEREIKRFEKMAEKKIAFFFIILYNEKPVGTIDIWKTNLKHKRTCIGYAIDRKYWKKGIATKSVEMILDFIKNEMHLHGVEGAVHPKNIASQRVLEKNGFKKIGLMKDYYYFNEKYIDRLLYWKTLD